MTILVIGGTGLTGRHLLRELVGAGDDVMVFHRGKTHAALPEDIPEILGDKSELGEHKQEFSRLVPTS